MTGQESCNDCLFRQMCQPTVDNAVKQAEFRERLEAARAGYVSAADHVDVARDNFSTVAHEESMSQAPSERLTVALRELDRSIADKAAWRGTVVALEGNILDHTDPTLAAKLQEAGDLGQAALKSCDGRSCAAREVLPKMVEVLTK